MMLRIELVCYRVLESFARSWDHSMAWTISFWASCFWALGLLPNPEPVALVHKYMDSLMALRWWGVLSLALGLMIFCSLHVPALRIGRRASITAAAGYWCLVATLFWLSGVSITGRGVYTVITFACVWSAVLSAEVNALLDRWRLRFMRKAEARFD